MNVRRVGYAETLRCAVELGRQAAARGLVIDDTLAGEVQRFRVLRAIKQAYPALDSTALDWCVWRALLRVD